MSGLVYASTAKPSVPAFTLSFDKHSSDKPATYVTDPYTGKQRELEPPKHYEWETVTVKINNQPFTPYQTNDGNATQNIDLYYSIRTKGHFGGQWVTSGGLYTNYYPANSGQITEVTFFVGSNGPNGDSMPNNMVLNVEDGGQVDFEVQALIGYLTPQISVTQSFGVQNYEVFTGIEGDWSNTQTLTIGENTATVTPSASLPSQSVSPSENQNPTPNQSNTQIVFQLGLDWASIAVVVLLGVIAVLLFFMAVFLYKRNIRKSAKM